MTKTQLQEWHAHPITQEILNYISERKVELALEPIVNPETDLNFSIDNIVVKTAVRDGFLLGCNAIDDAYEYFLSKEEK